MKLSMKMYLTNIVSCEKGWRAMLKLWAAQVIVLVSAACAFAVAAESDNSAQQLSSLLSGSDYFQANFIQTVRDTKGEIVDQSNGSMLLSRPDKLRWNIDAPIEQTIVVNNGEYFQYDRDIDQLIIQALSDQLSAMPSLLMSGDVNAINSQFSVAEVKAISASSTVADNPVIRVFTLKPLDQDSLFEVLTLEFTNQLLQAIAILDDMEQVSRFEFSEVDTLSRVDDTQFVLNPPEGTDIIRR